MTKYEFVEKKRLQYNWSKAKMARFLDVSEVTYHYWKTERLLPSKRQLQVLIFFSKVRKFLEGQRPDLIEKMNDEKNSVDAQIEAFVAYIEHREQITQMENEDV